MNEKENAYERSRMFCSTREAADRIGISLRTVQHWVDNGTLDAWKTDGGHRRVSVESIERVMRKKRRGARDANTDRVQEPTPAERLRILVVEDDNVLLKLYRVRIASWQMPIDITTASNGYDALILIGREQPDLMIADLQMPHLDGFQMLRTLSTSPFREGMEIVVVTGMSPAEIAENGNIPPGVRLLHKPIPFIELQGIVESILSRRSMLTGE
jgi:excisionase family DNA binding protein